MSASVSTTESNPGVRAYVTLGLIGLITCISFIDRVMVGALAPQIQADLDLTDTELGLVTGFAFTLFYAICGFPLALTADRASRRWLIGISVAVWSLATAACGLAKNFMGLFVARLAVGFGEAGAGPASYSLIWDLFPPRMRAPASSIYVFGAMAGTTLGLSLAGWIAAHYGWQATFFIFGLPGLLVAVAAVVLIQEPKRGAQEADPTAFAQPLPIGQIILFVMRNVRFLSAAVANGFAAFLTYGMSLWLPSFFTRTHGLTVEQTATSFGVSFGLALMVGALSGGALGGYVVARGGRLLSISAICMFAAGAIYVAALWTADTNLAIALVAVCGFITGLAGPSYTAATLDMVEPRVRATAQAVVTFMNAVIAYAIGAGGIGVISDAIMPSVGSDSLRWALTIGQVFCVLAGAIYLALLFTEKGPSRS